MAGRTNAADLFIRIRCAGEVTAEDVLLHLSELEAAERWLAR
jgi:hypothetical protein